jgi:hypothetical protein
MSQGLQFAVESADITQFPADLIALKYAQAFYGADQAVARLLVLHGIDEARLRPAAGDCRLVETGGALPTPRALFVGMGPLHRMGYRDLRQLAAATLRLVGREAPETRHLAITIHGPGFGLDEAESVLSQLGGILEVVEARELPPALERLTMVEIRPDRVERLRLALESTLGTVGIAKRLPDRWGFLLGSAAPTLAAVASPARRSREIDSAGTLAEKRSVFVAMPFAREMDDVFYYGIQRPAHNTGLLCERVDQETYTGDILARVKERIEAAAVVIAELTGANPNVYLEVGYAWGKGRPTILVVKSDQELKFDVRGQKCLTYERIRDLEEALRRELAALLQPGRA